MTQLSPSDIRAKIRRGEITGETSRYAPGFVQLNLAIIPAEFGDEFFRFCQMNSRPCPVLEMLPAGEFSPKTLGDDIDVRHDFPRYIVWKDGEPVDEVTDISDIWRDDLACFLIGCSFSFEGELLRCDVPVRHIDLGRTVPMYNTNIPLHTTEHFGGNYVVSMRPMTPAQAIRAVQVTTPMSKVHGAPIHLANPEAIGITAIENPDYGDKPEIYDGEIPVFWPCGVTPQQAIRYAHLPFAITHKPGHMLISDLKNTSLLYA